MAGAKANSAMLAGCRVLDFTQYLAGPTVTRLMAEMGADIIKVELAPMGDPSRLLPTVKNGRSGYFVQQNRGKKSICLDLNKPESLEILRAMVPKVDIVVLVNLIQITGKDLMWARNEHRRISLSVALIVLVMPITVSVIVQIQIFLATCTT